MEALGVIFLLGLIGLVFGLPIAAIVKSASARREVEELRGRLRELITVVTQLQNRLRSLESNGLAPLSKPSTTGEAITIAKQEESGAGVKSDIGPSDPAAPPPSTLDALPIAMGALKESDLVEAYKASPPPLPPGIASIIAERDPSAKDIETVAPKITPPPLPSAAVRTQPPTAPKLPALSLEQFMGVEALCVAGWAGAAFRHRFLCEICGGYSWISPALRAAMGYLVGRGCCWWQGVILHRKKRLHSAGRRTFLGNRRADPLRGDLCRHTPTGSCRCSVPAGGVWHHDAGHSHTGASLLPHGSMRFPSSSLGIVGGFLTPILCSTGAGQSVGTLWLHRASGHRPARSGAGAEMVFPRAFAGRRGNHSHADLAWFEPNLFNAGTATSKERRRGLPS